MQTFLPNHSFVKSASLLDSKRLGKQRAEAKQILNALQGKSKGWRNHPATLMWYGYEPALRYYHDIMIAEWINRGYRNKMPPLWASGFGPDHFIKPLPEHLYPHWWHDNDVLLKIITSHQSNLLRKDRAYYADKLDWVNSGNHLYPCVPSRLPPDNLPYYWPVTKEEVEAKRVLEFCS